MLTTNLLRNSVPALVTAIDNALPPAWNSCVSGFVVTPTSINRTHMTIWCRHKQIQGQLTAIEVYINDDGDFFTARDDVYPVLKDWLNTISSRERQRDRNNQIREELLHRVALKFEPMASF